MSIGWLIALLVLICAFVLFIVGRMDGLEAALFGGLALAIMLSPFPVKFPWATA